MITALIISGVILAVVHLAVPARIAGTRRAGLNPRLYYSLGRG